MVSTLQVLLLASKNNIIEEEFIAKGWESNDY
jgi:hypothetical protein